MNSRLHTTLVYFGVVTDPQLSARLSEAPITGWRAVAVATAFVVVAALSIGLLVLLKAIGASPLLVGLVLVFEVTVIARFLAGGRDHA